MQKLVFTIFAIWILSCVTTQAPASEPVASVATLKTDTTVYFPEDTVFVTLRNESNETLLFSWHCDWSIVGFRLEVSEWESLYRPDCSRIRVMPERLEPGQVSTHAVWPVPWDISELSWYGEFRVEVRVQGAGIPSATVSTAPFKIRRY